MFEVQNTIYILRSFVVLNNNRFTRFLTLSKQRIDNNITNKSSIKNKINFYKREKLEFDNQRIFFEDIFYFEKFNVTIVQLNCKTNNIKIFNIKLNFVTCEVFKTRTTRAISIEFINSLKNKYSITQILNKFLYLLSKTFDINQLNLSLSRKIERQRFQRLKIQT